MDLKSKKNIKPFDGEKYSIWKLRIRGLLTKKNLIDVIDGKSSENSESSDWQAKNMLAKAIVLENLADSHLHFATPERTAREVIKSLDDLFERKSIAAQIAVKKRLFALKFDSDTALMKHFIRFDDLLPELQAAGAALEESDKIAHLLVTLPPSYNGIITAIETLCDENLSVAFVQIKLLDHELKLKTDKADNSAKILQASDSATSATKGKRQFRNSKFVKNFRQKPKQANRNNFKACYHCGRKNHMIKDCVFYKKTLKSKTTHPQSKWNEFVNVSTENEKHQSILTVSSFAFMAQENSNSSDSDDNLTFILDSGASTHIVKTESAFKSFVHLNPPIKKSVAKNGAHIFAYKKGNIPVRIEPGFEGVLKDVLYCPEVPYNLLSVRKIQEAGFDVIFNQQGVTISKGITVVMIGDQLADLLTKQLSTTKFKKLRPGLGLQN
ncbi:unnamed protein product [Bemisia tabaci]|uniref:CCHC-type domain-containing protein n=1 Tax=Bemisia tabaci TaxID=7038 RepID=A0A9P0EZZ1_BEMTA|nr:unnamed protein product [Bemisia tabaci]